LMAGVGAQRGSGMHIKWVKEQRARVRREQADKVGSPKGMVRPPSPLSVSSDDSREIGEGHILTRPNLSRSPSIASTNSDILTRYFPQRYFILKSLAQVGSPLLIPQLSITHTLAVRPGPERSKEYLGNAASQRGDSRPGISHQRGRVPHI
jgi:hypothetical protein